MYDENVAGIQQGIEAIQNAELGHYFGVNSRQTGKTEISGAFFDGLIDAALTRRIEQNSIETTAAQLIGVPADNVVPVIFPMNIVQIIGQDALERIHGLGLPETLLLDIYMSWRNQFRRPPSTNADFTHVYSYVEEQLEMIYEGMIGDLGRRAGRTDYYTVQDMIRGELDFIVNCIYRVGQVAELELGHTLNSLPNHEFIFDSVRQASGPDSLSITLIHDPRMTSIGGEGPVELGPTEAPPRAPHMSHPPILDIVARAPADIAKDRYGF